MQKENILYFNGCIKNMPRFIISVLCCTIFLSGISADALTDRVFRVGVTENYPICFVENGHFNGLAVDLITAIAKKEKLKIIFVQVDSSSILKGIWPQEVDLLLDTVQNDTYVKMAEFPNEPILKMWGFIYTKREIISDFRDLAGKKIAVREKGFFYPYLLTALKAHSVDAHIILCRDHNHVIRCLGRTVDYALMNSLYGVIKENGATGFFRTSLILPPVPLYFAVKKGENRALSEKLSNALGKMKKNGKSVYYRILNKWYSAVNMGQYVFIRTHIILSVIFILFAVPVLILLKRKVEKQKRDLLSEEARSRHLLALFNTEKTIFKKVLETSPLGIIILNETGNVIFFNRMIEKIFPGLNWEQMFMYPVHEIEPFSDKHFVVKRLFAEKENIYEMKYRIETPHSPKFYSASGIIYDSIYQGKEYVFFIEDITEPEILRNEASILKEEVAFLGRSSELDRLATNIAHDFNNLLFLIQINLDMIEIQTPPDSDIQINLHELRNALRFEKNLINKILGFSRRSPFQLKPLEMNETVLEFTEILRKLMGNDIELKTKLLEEKNYINGDKNSIEQILLNLVVNARDAISGKGTVEILLEYISDFRNSGTDFLKLSVSDTGSGIHETHREKIFQPFFTTKEPGKGTGLGLSIVSQAVKAHGGSIEFETTAKGTVFDIYIPAIDYTPKQEKVRFTPSSYSKLKHRTILIIEDERILRDSLIKFFDNYFMKVYDATDNKEAEKVFSGNHIDVILSDLQLSDGSVIFLLKDFQKRDKDVKIILTSGYFDDEIEEMGRTLGFDLLLKPYHMVDVLSLLCND